MKDKYLMVISVDAEKSFDIIQHPFIIKTLKNLVVEGFYFNLVKLIYGKPTSYATVKN